MFRAAFRSRSCTARHPPQVHSRTLSGFGPSFTPHAADWSREVIARSGQFEPGARVVVPWTRALETRAWITEERSKSYLDTLQPADREQLLARVARLLADNFPGGRMEVAYRTAIWIARRR